jgi:hypothetical protein
MDQDGRGKHNGRKQAELLRQVTKPIIFQSSLKLALWKSQIPITTSLIKHAQG